MIAAEERERPPADLERARRIVEPPQRTPQPVECVGRLVHRPRGLERISCGRPITPHQRVDSDRKRAAVHTPIIARIKPGLSRFRAANQFGVVRMLTKGAHLTWATIPV